MRIVNLSHWTCAALFATALGLGCAQTRERVGVMSSSPGADATERAYDMGYKFGKQEGARGGPSQYQHFSKWYDAQTEKAFSMGFGDGYAGRENRMASPQVREWMYGGPEGAPQ